MMTSTLKILPREFVIRGLFTYPMFLTTSLIKSGRSSGVLLDTKLRSTTTLSSDQIPPANSISGLIAKKLVIFLPFKRSAVTRT